MSLQSGGSGAFRFSPNRTVNAPQSRRSSLRYLYIQGVVYQLQHLELCSEMFKYSRIYRLLLSAVAVAAVNLRLRFLLLLLIPPPPTPDTDTFENLGVFSVSLDKEDVEQ